MAYPSFRSSSSNSAQAVSSLVVTKPSGVAVGDVLYAFVASQDASSATISISGWTAVTTQSSQLSFAVLRKIADSGDVSASNYTVNYVATVDIAVATLIAISGTASGQEIKDQFFDYIDSTSSGVATLAGTATPNAGNESLIMTYLITADNNLSAALTSSARTTSNSVTLTEQVDYGFRDNGTQDGCNVFVATGQYSGSSSFTQATFTISEDLTAGSNIAVGGVVIFNSAQSATGTNTLLNVTPTIFTNAGVTVGTTGTNTLLQTSPDFPTQSGTGTSPTTWTNESKNTSTWTNENKS